MSQLYTLVDKFELRFRPLGKNFNKKHLSVFVNGRNEVAVALRLELINQITNWVNC